MKNKIFLVDNDRNILLSVSMALEGEGFAVETFSDGESGLKAILKKKPDLVILDVKMPRMDGIEVLTKLREESSIPVIFLTSKDDEVDHVIGLRMGADDYITKPFSQRLLLERIKALLRRRDLMNAEANGVGVKTDKIQYGNLVLDDSRHLCAWKGQPLNLTVTEYLIVKALALRPGHVRNRDQLIDMAYGENIYVDDRTIDSHIKRIRRKFKKMDNNFDKIETLYGVGYRYKEDSI
ncbi:MAG: response regulator transcription factor [Alphaproteobacteria bacterium]|nr:response regulator transcription factor [Alphaproteobacteria bacterium]